MKQVFFHDGVLMYYGNPAGYLSGEKAVIDSMFDKKELRDYLESAEKLEVVVKEGIYDRLSRKGTRPEELEAVKDCILLRIHQMKKDTPILLRFISLNDREKKGYGSPAASEYETVYEAETDEADLEAIWERFNTNPPKEFEGHSLSISDVVELSAKGVSRFFYIDRTDFVEITFREEPAVPSEA